MCLYIQMSLCASFNIQPGKYCCTGYMLVKLRNVHYVLTIRGHVNLQPNMCEQQSSATKIETKHFHYVEMNCYSHTKITEYTLNTWLKY